MGEEKRYKHVPDYGDWYVLDQKDGKELYGSLIEDRLNAYESRVKELEEALNVYSDPGNWAVSDRFAKDVFVPLWCQEDGNLRNSNGDFMGYKLAKIALGTE